MCQLHTVNSSSLFVILQQSSLQSPMSWWRYSDSTLCSSHATGKLFSPTYPVVLSSLRMHNVFLSRFHRLHCLLQAKNGLNSLCEHCIDILVLSQSLVKYISSFSSANNITASSDLTQAVLCAGCREILCTNQIHLLLASLNSWRSVPVFPKQQGWHRGLHQAVPMDGTRRLGMGSRVRPRDKEHAEPVPITPKCRIKGLGWVFCSSWGKDENPSQDKMLAGPNRVGRSSWEMYFLGFILFFFSNRSF